MKVISTFDVAGQSKTIMNRNQYLSWTQTQPPWNDPKKTEWYFIHSGRPTVTRLCLLDSVNSEDHLLQSDPTKQTRCTILVTIQHRCVQHVDESGYYNKANTHPHATRLPLVLRMIVWLDIAGAAGGETSVWGLLLTVSVGCRPWLDGGNDLREERRCANDG